MADTEKKPGFFARMSRSIRDMKGELKKVVWPTPEKVAKNTGTVILYSVLIGACIWIFDGVAGLFIKTIFGLFNA